MQRTVWPAHPYEGHLTWEGSISYKTLVCIMQLPGMRLAGKGSHQGCHAASVCDWDWRVLPQKAHKGLIYAQLLALHVNAMHQKFCARGGQLLERGSIHLELQRTFSVRAMQHSSL